MTDVSINIIDAPDGRTEQQRPNRPIPREEHDLLLEIERDKFNTYASNKSVSQEFLNTSIIQSQIGILISLFSRSGSSLGNFDISLIVFIAISIILQITVAFLVALLLNSTRENVGKKRRCTTTGVNGMVTLLSGVGLIVNVVITALSIETNKINS